MGCLLDTFLTPVELSMDSYRQILNNSSYTINTYNEDRNAISNFVVAGRQVKILDEF